MQHVPATNQSDHIGRVEHELLIDRVGIGLQFVHVAAVPIQLDVREQVGLGIFHAQFRGEALTERVGHEEVQLIGEAHARFIDRVGADGPYP